MRTLNDLRTEVLRYFDVADEPAGSADVELVTAALNQANQRRAGEDDWDFMLSKTYTLTIEAGTREYILPRMNVDKLQYLWSTTKSRFAEEVPLRQAPYEGQFSDTTDPTFNYEFIADGSPVREQPTYPDQLIVTSSLTEADDVGLYIEGEDEDGEPLSETIMAGDTGEEYFETITYVAKVGDWTGTMTLTTEAEQELLTLTADEAGKLYPVLRFFADPLAAESFTYRFYRKPRVMTRDHDTPDIPFPTCNILVYDALLDLATYNELDSESVGIWRDKQQQWELNLYQRRLTAASVNGAPWSINAGRR